MKRLLFALIFALLVIGGAHAQAVNVSGNAGGGTTFIYVDTFPSGGCTVSAVVYTTQLDCAFYTAVANGNSAILLGQNANSATYASCAGLVEPGTGSQIAIIGLVEGDNIRPTEIKATCAMQAVISHASLATGTSLPYNMNIHNVNIDANNQAQQCIALYDEKVGHSEHVHCRNALSTTLAWVEFGNPNPITGFVNIGYQYNIEDVFVQGSGKGTWATVTPSQSGGVPSIAVNAGGSYNYASPPAYLFGFGAGANPCTTMGTLSVTTTGAGPYTLSTVTPSGFSGCSGTLYAYVPDIPPAPYGISTSITDSTFKDLVVNGVGQTAGILYQHGSNVMIHEHAYGGMPILFWDKTQNMHYGAEPDTPIHYGIESDQTRTQWIGTQFIGGTPNLGASGFYLPNGGNYIISSTCSATSNSNGWNLVVNASGPIAHGNGQSYGSTLVFNGEQCDNLAIVTSLFNSNAGSLQITTDSTSPQLNVGSGANTTNHMGVSADRGAFGYDATNTVAGIASTGGVEFGNLTGTSFGTGIISGFNQNGVLRTAIGSSIADASTIAPTGSITHITGTGNISTITAPTRCTTTGLGCVVTLISDAGFALVTGGNIATAISTSTGQAVILTYDPTTTTWYH